MSAASFGMMSEAYFVGKRTLIAWINDFLQLDLKKVEELSNGAVYCHFLDALWPNTISMKKVDFSARNNFEIVKNWKIIQQSFDKKAVTKKIPVQRIIQGRFQDNLEFLQWFYHYFTQLYPGNNYDAVDRRSKSKGIKTLRTTYSQNKRKTNNNYISKTTKSNIVGKTKKTNNIDTSKINNHNNNEKIQKLKDKISELKGQLNEKHEELSKVYVAAENIETERNFYFNKAVKIEGLLGTYDDSEIKKSILKILYNKNSEDTNDSNKAKDEDITDTTTCNDVVETNNINETDNNNNNNNNSEADQTQTTQKTEVVANTENKTSDGMFDFEAEAKSSLLVDL